TELTGRLETVGLHDEAKKVVDRELKRLRQMSPQSAEYHVARTYLEVIASLPWSRTSDDRLDLKAARDILDRDHYDLKTVKERILEYLAVRTLNRAARGSIMCFVGPPGVGKTSLGQSKDDMLLDLASRKRLHEPAVLEEQMRRMLADPRADAMAENFAGQWLHLRNLEGIHPNTDEFPDFDNDLRLAFQREAELFFSSIMREDRSVM